MAHARKEKRRLPDRWDSDTDFMVVASLKWPKDIAARSSVAAQARMRARYQGFLAAFEVSVAAIGAD